MSWVRPIFGAGKEVAMRHLKFINFVAILIGSAIIGAGVNYFNIANNLAETGVTGIAVLLKLTLGINPGLSSFIINIPLLIIGWRVLGRYTLIYTIFGTLCLSGALYLFSGLRFEMEDPLLAALYAGVTVGIGMGLVFRFGGTTGGAAQKLKPSKQELRGFRSFVGFWGSGVLRFFSLHGGYCPKTVQAQAFRVRLFFWTPKFNSRNSSARFLTIRRTHARFQ